MSCTKRFATIVALACLQLSIAATNVSAQNAADSLNKLTPFIPNDAAIFFTMRPNQLLNSSVAREATTDYPKGFEIEFAAAAVSASSLETSMNRGAASGGAAPVPNMAILVRFVNEVSAEQLLSLTEGNPNSEGYRIQKWNGTEILRSEKEDAPAAWRFDPRTYIIADLESFVTGLRAGGKAMPAAIWNRIPGATKNDISVAIDSEAVLAYAQKHAMQIPPTANSAKFITVGFNLSKGDLLAARSEMTDEAAAEELLKGFEMIKMFGAMQASSALDPEMAEMVAPILSSIQANQDGSNFSIRVPRPANFEQLVAKIAEMGKNGQIPVPAAGF